MRLVRRAFTAAATVTLLAPQLAAGLVADDRSLEGLIVEAGIQGVAMPLVSAAVGGMFGVALWFSRPADASHRQRGARARGRCGRYRAVRRTRAPGRLTVSEQLVRGWLPVDRGCWRCSR